MTPPQRRTRAITDDEIAALRTRILTRASRLIGRRGIDGCSLSAVARDAGCSIGMIQHHFHTRDGLLLATIDFRSDESVREWRGLEASSADPITAIGKLLSFAVEGDETLIDAWGFWTQVYTAVPYRLDVRDTVTRTLALWRTLFVDAITNARTARLVPQHIDPDRVATVLIAAIDGLAIQAIGGFYGVTADTMRDTLLNLAADLLSLDVAVFTEIVAADLHEAKAQQ